MKTIAKIKRGLIQSVLLLAVLSIPMINSAAQVGNVKHEAFVISTIMPLNLLEYAATLKAGSANIEYSYEAEPKLESWMVDADSWKPMNNTAGYLLMEESEEPLHIESWMLEDFYVTSLKNTITDEPVIEEKAAIESWMLNPETWGK